MYQVCHKALFFTSWPFIVSPAYYKPPPSLSARGDIFIIINPLTARVVGAPQMILQPVFSIFPCSPLPSGTCWTPGLSIPWCCLPTSSFVCLVFFPLSLCLAKWFWPHPMNGRHDHTTAVCVFLRSSGDLHHWSNCLLDLGTDFLVGNVVFVWDV